MSKKLIRAIKKSFKDELLSDHAEHGDFTIVVDRTKLADIVRYLHDDPDAAFDQFIDLTAVDWPEREERFELVIHLRSLTHGHRLRVKTSAPADDPTFPTISPVYKGADWFEREAFDMYGVRFEGHPDLRRILLWDQFEGHPLRKDYPKQKRQCPIPFREEPPKQPKPFPERP